MASDISSLDPDDLSLRDHYERTRVEWNRTALVERTRVERERELQNQVLVVELREEKPKEEKPPLINPKGSFNQGIDQGDMMNFNGIKEGRLGWRLDHVGVDDLITKVPRGRQLGKGGKTGRGSTPRPKMKSRGASASRSKSRGSSRGSSVGSTGSARSTASKRSRSSRGSPSSTDSRSSKRRGTVDILTEVISDKDEEIAKLRQYIIYFSVFS